MIENAVATLRSGVTGGIHVKRYFRRALLVTALLAATAAVAIQLVPYGRDHDNPAVVLEPQWPSAEARSVAVKYCFDCHSNETEWPWYSNVAPFSWQIQDHVDEGRDELNFSRWDLEQEGREAAEATSEGEMPPWNYKPWRRMSSADRETLVAAFAVMFGAGGSEND